MKINLAFIYFSFGGPRRDVQEGYTNSDSQSNPGREKVSAYGRLKYSVCRLCMCSWEREVFKHHWQVSAYGRCPLEFRGIDLQYLRKIKSFHAM